MQCKLAKGLFLRLEYTPPKESPLRKTPSK